MHQCPVRQMPFSCGSPLQIMPSLDCSNFLDETHPNHSAPWRQQRDERTGRSSWCWEEILILDMGNWACEIKLQPAAEHNGSSHHATPRCEASGSDLVILVHLHTIYAGKWKRPHFDCQAGGWGSRPCVLWSTVNSTREAGGTQKSRILVLAWDAERKDLNPWRTRKPSRTKGAWTRREGCTLVIRKWDFWHRKVKGSWRTI